MVKTGFVLKYQSILQTGDLMAEETVPTPRNTGKVETLMCRRSHIYFYLETMSFTQLTFFLLLY